MGDDTSIRPAVRAWIETVTGMTLDDIRQIPAGGRLGYFVDVSSTTDSRELFLQVGRGLADGVSSFQGFAIEAEVYRALEPHGIPVPHVWGVDTELDLLLVDRVPGSVWFHPPAHADEQVSVAQDFVRHLARWHRVGAEEMDLPSFGPVTSWAQHQRAQLETNTHVLETTLQGQRADPLVERAMDWLRSNVPDADGPVVLVQGDTGPGNFLYQAGHVTGIIDWELAHLGDPMDDIAWMSWRTAQHGFTNFVDRLREYEVESGIDIDDDRVRYYRLNAFGRLGPHFGLASMSPVPSRALPKDTPAEVNRAADGSAMIISMLHRRMRLDATSDALGLDRPGRDVLEAPEPPHSAMYDSVLDQLRSMIPRIEDRTAANTAKAVARQVKYLRQLDRNGNTFADQELDDLGRLLGRTQTSLDEARPALVDATHAGTVSFENYVDYHWRRLRRDDHLMRDASGMLFDRGWPDLR